MNKNSIIHFVGFITKLHRDKFEDQWVRYAKESSPMSGSDGVILQEQTESNGKYKYLSQHEFHEEDFRFSFMKNRSSENFPEQKARVVMLGGYSPVEIGCKHWNEKSDAKVLVFFTHDRIDIDSYRNLPHVSCLNIYQPFYENCTYSHILEFFSKKNEARALVDGLLQRKEGEEISMYKRCQVSAIVS